MTAKPAIKGSAIADLVEDAQKLLETRRLSREEAARWLQPEDFARLLDQKILATDWCDIESYRRLLEMIRDVLGGGDNAYLCERGRLRARRLLDAGLYRQLEYMNRMQVTSAAPEERVAAFGRDLRLITTLAPSMLNFSKWTPQLDPETRDRYTVEVSEAEPLPEALCWTLEGFVNGMAPNAADARFWTWTWERPRPDLVVYRMGRAI